MGGKLLVHIEYKAEWEAQLVWMFLKKSKISSPYQEL
jgi:hypothetical protein